MRWILPALLCATLLSSDAHASAQCRLCPEGGALTEEKAASVPVRLEIEASLDFDKLVLTDSAGGAARLGPDGSRRTSGAVAALSARAMVGELLIQGEPGRQIRVSLPERVELLGPAGGTLMIRGLTSNLPHSPRLDGEGRLRMRFGGELFVSGDAEGDYRGDIPITVDYL